MDYHVKQVAKQDMHECTPIGKTYFLTDSAIAEDNIRQSQFKTGRIDRPTYIKVYKRGELVKNWMVRLLLQIRETVGNKNKLSKKSR